MKKILLAAAVSVLVSGTVAAETPGGGRDGALGGVAPQALVAGAVGLSVAAAAISNSRGTTLPPLPPPPPPLGCQGDDEINDNGFCVGTTTIVTGTGTNTFTAIATFTYAPQ